MRKNIFKIFIFLLVFCVSFAIVSKVLVRKGNGYGTDVLSFYHEPKNSMDLIFFGSSHSYATFSPKVLETETGLKSYNFATQQQPLWITYYYMKEALKYQKPKYFVLDVLMANMKEDYAEEGVNRDAIDKMRMSINKIEAINASVKKEERVSYYINLIKYHSRWNEINKSDITSLLPSNISSAKGFTYLIGDYGDAILDPLIDITENAELSDKSLEYLNKIIKLAEDNNIKLILVKSPCTLSLEQKKIYNKISDISDENNLIFLNYNDHYSELKLDEKKDFYDDGHLTGDAAERMTKYFSDYLKNNVIIKKGD